MPTISNSGRQLGPFLPKGADLAPLLGKVRAERVPLRPTGGETGDTLDLQTGGMGGGDDFIQLDRDGAGSRRAEKFRRKPGRHQPELEDCGAKAGNHVENTAPILRLPAPGQARMDQVGAVGVEEVLGEVDIEDAAAAKSGCGHIGHGAMTVPGGMTAFLGITTMPSWITQFCVSRSVPRGKGFMTTFTPMRAFLSMIAPSI